jgi:hypothetical protein
MQAAGRFSASAWPLTSWPCPPPRLAAAFWQARQWTTAVAGWGIWLLTMSFAIMATVGFTATNVSDVTQVRAGRSTPAIVAAQAALSDAMAARDRECKGGTGKYCREREATVVDQRAALDKALHEVEATSDPQVTAAVRLIWWTTRGAMTPSEGDISMLMLMALLPQCAGLVLMLGRRA